MPPHGEINSPLREPNRPTTPQFTVSAAPADWTSELEVPLIVRGDRHHRSGAILHQDEVRDVDRQPRSGERMAAEGCHGPKNHGLPADHAVLLRASRARAEPASGGNKDGCGTHRFRHLIQNLTDVLGWERAGAGGAQPLPCRERKNRAIPLTCGKSGICCSALAQMIELSKV